MNVYFEKKYNFEKTQFDAFSNSVLITVPDRSSWFVKSILYAILKVILLIVTNIIKVVFCRNLTICIFSILRWNTILLAEDEYRKLHHLVTDIQGWSPMLMEMFLNISVPFHESVMCVPPATGPYFGLSNCSTGFN